MIFGRCLFRRPPPKKNLWLSGIMKADGFSTSIKMAFTFMQNCLLLWENGRIFFFVWRFNIKSASVWKFNLLV